VTDEAGSSRDTMPAPPPDRPTQPTTNEHLTPGEQWLFEQLSLRFAGLEEKVLAALTQVHKTQTNIAVMKVDVEEIANRVESLHRIAKAAADEATVGNTARAQDRKRLEALEHKVALLAHRMGANGDTPPPEMPPDSDPDPASGH